MPPMWFVYVLIDPRDSTVFYVGKCTRLKDRLAQHMRAEQAPGFILRELVASGHAPIMKAVGSFSNSIECDGWEHSLIRRIPGLVNVTGRNAKIADLPRGPIADDMFITRQGWMIPGDQNNQRRLGERGRKLLMDAAKFNARNVMCTGHPHYKWFHPVSKPPIYYPLKSLEKLRLLGILRKTNNMATGMFVSDIGMSIGRMLIGQPHVASSGRIPATI